MMTPDEVVEWLHLKFTTDAAFWYNEGRRVLDFIEHDKAGFIVWVQQEGRLKEYTNSRPRRDRLVQRYIKERND